jgi:hypothetical protein
LAHWWATASRSGLPPEAQQRIADAAAVVDPGYRRRYLLATADVILRGAARAVRNTLRKGDH